MQRFAALLDRLVLTPQRNIKLRLIVDYFRTVPDPDRGYALAALAGELEIHRVKPAMLRALIESRVDGVLFAYSYDYVGDLAETISLIWPSPAIENSAHDNRAPLLSEIVEKLLAATPAEGRRLIETWLDALDPSGRWALIKLATGGLRIGVSARLAKRALAEFGDRQIGEIEEIWHGLTPPYRDLFSWLEQKGPSPQARSHAPFRPVMLSQPLSEDELKLIMPKTYAAEWKWDGVRIQAVRDRGIARLYTRTGDDISTGFPDLAEALDFDAVLDGELLIGSKHQDGFNIGSFSDLQKRLNRKTVSAKLLASHPAFVRAYDCLFDGAHDLRALTFRQRRKRLEHLIAQSQSDRLDISPLISYVSSDELQAYRNAPPEPVIEGVMLKRWDSVYEPGRPKGPWFKWKRDPHKIDAVLMYAQRGHGKRSSFYSDYTFGVWRDSDNGPELVPVGKAYFGFTDEELGKIDRFVRDNTLNRFGPVREVVHDADRGLVFEVAFEGIQRSTRHKSGLAMRFPRLSRLRWDKPPSEADRLETLAQLIGG